MLSATTGYKMPSQEIVEIFDIPSLPYIYFIPFTNIGLEITYQDKMTLEQLADPSLKLAGKKISIKLNAPFDYYPRKTITIIDFNSQTRIPVKLPDNIKIRDYKLSFDRKFLAFSHETDEGIELGIIELENGSFKLLNQIYLNDCFSDSGFWWMNDSGKILIKSIVDDRGAMPTPPPIPASPVIEETSGKTSTNRTYQNLLTSEYDKDLFDFFCRSQLLIVDIKNNTREKISSPAIYDEISLSPDNNFIFVEKVTKPYSYELPHYRFPRNFEILYIDGNPFKNIYQRPLQDQVPIGGTYQGPRRFSWQPFHDASLVWVEALDKGDPKVVVEYRDKIMRFDVSTDSEPEELFRTKYRFTGIEWSQDKDELIYSEYDRDRLWKRKWLLTLKINPAELILDISINDRYQTPGKLIHRTTARGEVVFLKDNQTVFFNNLKGATPEGDSPYLSKMDLKTQKQEILYRCRKDFFETVVGFSDPRLEQIVITSENNSNPRNYYQIDLNSSEKHKLTDFQNPYPKSVKFKKELITFPREDGVTLSGTLYLPVDYKQGDKLPLIYHAYPEEYTDISTAGQIKSSPDKFIGFHGATIKYFALKGYAILANASIPIIGDPETVNETFIEQLLLSVKAAIEHLDTLGIIDPDRVGIIGHSYGAFMVANVLVHSDLCCAGIAKSGAYNRTLTPFGFQSERRTLWQAREFYLKVSPYLYAEQINEPLLLIHGENDPNSGTYPLQSQRMYQALKGNGSTAKLVILPLEEHGYYARKSNLHVLAEIIEWFEKYVKHGKEEN